jgi:hypothetical protein
MYSIAAGRIIVALVPNACSIHEILTRREPAIQMANVNLIAAAPELLAALKIATEWFSSVDDTRITQQAIDNMRDAARAAIAKAEGRS